MHCAGSSRVPSLHRGRPKAKIDAKSMSSRIFHWTQVVSSKSRQSPHAKQMLKWIYKEETYLEECETVVWVEVTGRKGNQVKYHFGSHSICDRMLTSSFACTTTMPLIRLSLLATLDVNIYEARSLAIVWIGRTVKCELTGMQCSYSCLNGCYYHYPMSCSFDLLRIYFMCPQKSRCLLGISDRGII